METLVNHTLRVMLVAAASLAAVAATTAGEPRTVTFVAQTAPCLATVRLYWDANTEPDLAGYRMSWGTASRAYASEQGGIAKTATTFEVVGLPCGVRQYFAVRAFDALDRVSGFSNEVSVLTAGLPATTRVPSPPTKTTARPVP